MKHWLFALLAAGVLLAGAALRAQPPAMLYGSEPELDSVILITIDDCADEALTRAMFDLLVDNAMKAAFFPNTQYITRHNPQLWRDIAAAGFDIGYHTRTHAEGMTPAELDADFALFQQEIRDLLGDPAYTIRFVRPPYGIWDANWMAWAEGRGLVTVRWNIAPRARQTFDYVQAVLTNRDTGGAILLLHPRRFDLNWLTEHVDDLLALRTPRGLPYWFAALSDVYSDGTDG